MMRRDLAQADWPIAVATALVLALGLTNLYSAAHARPALFTQQLAWVAVGVTVFAAATVLDYRALLPPALALHTVGVALLALVLAFGREAHGSRRWIAVGDLSLGQPSEFIKLLLVLAVARYLHRTPAPEGRALKQILAPAVITAVPVALVLRQPDLGTAGLITLVFSTVMVLAGLNLRSLLALLAIGAVAAPPTWAYLLKDYQRTRILTFLDPGGDPIGAGWHTQQALIAVGSGGLVGKGYLRGTQTQLDFVPEPWSDFPFAVWSEEWGLVGALGLLALYLFLIARVLMVAAQARDRFGGVVCAGVAAMIFWHVAINVGMVTGLLPVAGVTLPLFSHGGSSLVTVMAGLGLVMSVSLRRHAL